MKIKRSRLPVNIIVPSILSLALFVVVIFFIIIPYFEESIMDRKKEMIKELTNSAWSILNEMDQEFQDSLMTLEQAQSEAVLVMQNLKYGEEFKDYFWITDMHPRMIIHPYRPDLKGADLSNYTDPNGKRLFVECVKTVEKFGEGYVDYMWQYKEDSTHIVPKLSYVKGFEKWGWVVGTGIYIEDVSLQIQQLTRRLIYISLFISLFIGFILYYLVHVNLITERKRIITDRKLNESYDKYKTLVEASTEGIVMIINKDIAFYNFYILNLLGYTDEEFKSLSIYDILFEKEMFKEIFNAEQEEKNFVRNFDTKLIKKNGELHESLLSLSKVNFHGENGFILAVKDISLNKDVEYELDQNIEKFKAITNNIDIGIFRTSIGRKGSFTEINKSAMEIIGYTEADNIYNINILDLLYSNKEKKEIINSLNSNKNINKQIIKIKRLDGVVITAMISLFIAPDETGKGTFCDGIIQDITLQKKLESEKDSMIEELMTSGMFMNQTVKNIAEQVPVCDINTSIIDGVNLMVKKNSEAVLVKTENNLPVGIVTENDLPDRVISKELSFELPIAKIMSSPLITISENALLFEALLRMKEKDVNLICIEGNDGSVSEVVNIKNIAFAKYQTHTMQMHRIKKAENYEELKDIFDSIPILLRTLIENGAKTDIITRINSSFTDEISLKVMEFVMEELDEPPADFGFITVGSVGRGEQTFLTDQDNAIIYEDVPEDVEGSVRSYFLDLGELLNKRLNEVGYNYCKGEVMARNPKWCMPVSGWKKQFRSWIIHSNPQDLIDVNIFFDIKNAGKNPKLAKLLQDYIYEIVQGQKLFFYHLSETILSMKPPLTFFGNFIVESTKENKSVFDIKKVIMLITGIARIYSLYHNVKETNTLRRLKQLNMKGILSDEQYTMLSKNFAYLMLMRMNRQLEAISKNQEPNNFINPKYLSDIERTTLKKIFSQLSEFQTKINLDFRGTMK